MNRGNPVQLLHARRCGAHARTTGQPCRSPAMKNGRCRMHGGKAGRKPTHGRYAKAAVAERRAMRALLRSLRALIGQVEKPQARSASDPQPSFELPASRHSFAKERTLAHSLRPTRSSLSRLACSRLLTSRRGTRKDSSHAFRIDVERQECQRHSAWVSPLVHKTERFVDQRTGSLGL
jgi:hypothetical protein